MSREVQSTRAARNYVTFPRQLRDAIPDQELCAGRVLQLESADAVGLHSFFGQRRVGLRLEVCETGKLTGKFAVLVDLDPDAARGLANLVLDAVAQAEKLP